jgi:ChrR Cupin-like domain
VKKELTIAVDEPVAKADVSPIVLRALFDATFSPLEYGQFVPLAEGVTILPLYGRAADGDALPSGGPSAAFLKYLPGAAVPAHRHPGYEHIIILSGSQRDERGVYPRGSCLISAPGTKHAVSSDDGCIALAIWNEPVVFEEPEGLI